jgi:hypothetical protein
MNNKLKELSLYCCKPANEQEYEFIKTCARLGGVNVCLNDTYDARFKYMAYSDEEIQQSNEDTFKLIPVTQFCDILLKDESEFDDRVEFAFCVSYCMSSDSKTATARDGYKFRLSEDCKTVELIKSEQ